jgi:hypothetical protein
MNKRGIKMTYLEIREYKRTNSTQRWGTPVKINHEDDYSRDKFIKYIVNSSFFFKKLGGKEINKGFKQISINPNRLEKTVFELKNK